MTAELDRDYAAALASAKATIQAARTRAVLAVTSELIGLYWDLGRMIADRQEAQGWGAKVVERFSNDLRAAFPAMSGLSPRNLRYMRDFARAWPDPAFVPQVVARLPWGHNRLLLDKLDEPAEREWYARAAIANGWSRVVLEHQILTQLHRRAGAAPSNFARLLPAADSGLMQQATKDPYHLEFLTIAGAAHERDVEQAMIDQLDRFLRAPEPTRRRKGGRASGCKRSANAHNHSYVMYERTRRPRPPALAHQSAPTRTVCPGFGASDARDRVESALVGPWWRAAWYTQCMTIQVPTRFRETEVQALDELVADGVADSRSEVIRLAVARLAERHRRAKVGAAIVAAYRAEPQTAEEDAWALANAIALTEAEPW
jgi:predicted nuclease of restriction endonuclease-like (RecB) superfamily/Arc/MetJ-type ribon-helix-helix transcriptional regulator